MGGAASERDAGNVTWLLGAAAAAVLLRLALFRRKSLERTAKAGLGMPRWLNLTAFGVIVVGFGVSIVHSWFIASYFS